MRIEDGDAPPTASDDRRDDEESREKVIVRSNGVVTYVGKDIANQFWKFGLLGRDFRYRRSRSRPTARRCGRRRRHDGEPGAPPFGHAERIYNVIDSRQMYLQALLSQALRTLGHPEGSRELRPLLVRDGRAVARDGARARLPVRRGRRGEEAVRRGVGPQGSRREDRRPARPADREGVGGSRASATRSSRAEECRRVGVADRGGGHPLLHAEVLARQADRLRHGGGAQLRGRDRTVPAVRGRPRQQHLQQAEGARGPERDATCWRGSTRRPPTNSPADGESDAHDLWALVFEASRLDDIVEQTVRALEFSVLAKYAFGLAQLFNAFYHRYPILNEEDAATATLAGGGVAYFRTQLTRALGSHGHRRARPGCNDHASHRHHGLPQARRLQAGDPARRRRGPHRRSPR